MGYNSKKLEAMAKAFQCRNRPNLSEVVYKTPCECDQNLEDHGQKETTYFKGSFLSSSAIKIMLSKHVVLIMRIINCIIINMEDIRQGRLSEGPILSLNKNSRNLWSLRP